MRITLRSAVVLTFQSPRGRTVVFFVLAVVRAALISGFTYVAIDEPLWRWGLFGKGIHWFAQVLQFPIVLFSHSVGLLIPYVASPFDFGLPRMRAIGAFDQRPWLPHHLRAGIITYTILFHVPTALRWLRSWRGGKEARVAT